MNRSITLSLSTSTLALCLCVVALRHAAEKRRKRSAYMAKWVRRNHEKVKATKRAESKRNAWKHRDRKKAYCLQNKERIKANRRIRERQRYLNDPSFRLRRNIRRMLNLKLGNSKKFRRSQDFVGCTWDHFKTHIENRFVSGMSWQNYGGPNGQQGWHLDHIIPQSKFDMTNPDDVKRCFHYTNFQPLWSEDNREKWNKIDPKYGNTEPCLLL